MSKTDDEAAAYYDNPANRITTGPGVRRKRTFSRNGVYISPETAARIRRFADEDAMTYGSWIRQCVDLELTRRETQAERDY